MSVNWRDEALRRYPPPPIDEALVHAQELIDEWGYDEDPHGFCHIRPVLLSLVAAVERAKGVKA